MSLHELKTPCSQHVYLHTVSDLESYPSFTDLNVDEQIRTAQTDLECIDLTQLGSEIDNRACQGDGSYFTAEQLMNINEEAVAII